MWASEYWEESQVVASPVGMSMYPPSRRGWPAAPARLDDNTRGDPAAGRAGGVAPRQQDLQPPRHLDTGIDQAGAPAPQAASPSSVRLFRRLFRSPHARNRAGVPRAASNTKDRSLFVYGSIWLFR